MVRKQVFNAEDIVRAGFEVVDAGGWEQLTARNVAEALGSSTAPVYSNFASMGELSRAVVEGAVARFVAETRKPRSEDPFLNIGLGVLEFAWGHPHWYEALFRGKEQEEDQDLAVLEGMVEAMAGMPQFAGLSQPERTILLKKMAIFTHGMALEICARQEAGPGREEMELLLTEVGAALVEDALRRPRRSDEEIELLGSFHKCSERRCAAEEEEDHD